mgnify:CR=1 FL=1
MNGLHTLIEFEDGDKWFVAAEKVIDNSKYSYLVRVNDNEDDFIDEYQLAKSIVMDDGEYMVTVKDKKEEERIIPILIPESLNIAEEFKKLKQL